MKKWIPFCLSDDENALKYSNEFLDKWWHWALCPLVVFVTPVWIFIPVIAGTWWALLYAFLGIEVFSFFLRYVVARTG